MRLHRDVSAVATAAVLAFGLSSPAQAQSHAQPAPGARTSRPVHADADRQRTLSAANPAQRRATTRSTSAFAAQQDTRTPASALPHTGTPPSPAGQRQTVRHTHARDAAAGTARNTGRLAGADRFATAVAISRRAFPTTAASVYLARADDFADALAGGALTDGPVLLAPSTGAVPQVVLDEIARLQPREVLAIGGAGALSETVLNQGAQGRPTARLAGADRFATAAAISRRAFPGGASQVYLAGAYGSPDALVGGALRQGPVLPVLSTGAVPGAIRAEIDRLAPASVLALGGPAAVSQKVLVGAADGRPTERLAGADRFATAARIARHAFPGGAKTAYLARSDVFADAVAGGVLSDGPILLVPPPATVRADLLAEAGREADALGVDEVIALGGAAAVTDATLNAVSQGATGDAQTHTTAPTPNRAPTEAATEQPYCDTAIRKAWPLKRDPRYRISCVDEVSLDGEPQKTVFGLTTSTVTLATGELIEGHIQIRRGLPADLTDAVIVHELAHAYSYTRLTLAQRTWFAQQLGQLDFEAGRYEDMPSEIWANTQGTCLGYPVPATTTVACQMIGATEKR
ncbi:cell wall-binding repeat-containing protein [Gephyromycinifex aptenodytis]|uniref:cell wall-binding repeat-containing protein n=1 Tax=Gephyromycinifex aptenodytis TaxID=2716227 RepID=UPI001445345B|nr:cell wall-binding repeat-containing protein [Gephyromycinifex aptenodytis]